MLLGLTLNAAGKALNVQDLDADVKYLMSQFDSDRNGTISRSEFHSALLRCGSNFEPRFCCHPLAFGRGTTRIHVYKYTSTRIQVYMGDVLASPEPSTTRDGVATLLTLVLHFVVS